MQAHVPIHAATGSYVNFTKFVKPKDGLPYCRNISPTEQLYDASKDYFKSLYPRLEEGK